MIASGKSRCPHCPGSIHSPLISKLMKNPVVRKTFSDKKSKKGQLVI